MKDIEFLRSKGIFDEGFLEYLKDFRLHRRYICCAGGHGCVPKRAYHNGESPCGAGFSLWKLIFCFA